MREFFITQKIASLILKLRKMFHKHDWVERGWYDERSYCRTCG